MNDSSVITEAENRQVAESAVGLKEKHSNCIHCGTTIRYRDKAVFSNNGDPFCCWGCETVYKILKKGNFSLINKPSTCLPEYDFLDTDSFLKDYSVSVDNKKSMRFFVEGIQCTACLWIIDQIPDWVPQVENAHLNMSQNTLLVSLKEPGYFGKVASVLSALGYKAYPIKSLDEAKHFLKKENHQQLMKLGVAAACSGNIMLFSFSLYSGLKGQMAGFFGYLNLAFFLPILFYCAQPFYRNLWRSLKAGRPSIDLPIVAAVIIGFALSLLNLIQGNDDFYFDSLSILIFLLLASRYLLSRTQQTFINSSYMQTFIDSQACQRWNDKSEEYDKIPARLLNVDDKVLIKEGERVPADGIVLNEWVNINPSILTGESLPQKLFKDSVIYAGTQVVAGYAKILVKQTAGNSRIGQILKKVEEQIYNKTPLISLTDKAAQYFSIFILIAGALFFSFYMNVDLTEAVKRTLALIILACPCALAFATPLTQSLSLKKASKKGYLIKNAESLEKLNYVKNAFFDKTGTLTQGQFEFLKWKSPHQEESGNFSPDQETLNAIYSIEVYSQHPIARTLVKHLEGKCVKKLPVHSLAEIPGSGISGTIDNDYYKIVSALPDDNDKSDSDIISSLTALYKNGKLIAYACLGDRLHSDAKQTISQLNNMGIKTYILSGDTSIPVSSVAKKLQIANEQFSSSLIPEKKNEIIKNFPNSLMVGDGANDSLAMSADTVSIAVQGSVESCLVAADIYVTKKGVSPVKDLILLSKNTFDVIKRNLIFSFVYNFAGGLAALLGYISPLTAAILMPVSSLVVLSSSALGTKFLRRFNKINFSLNN
ncbi:MAG: heavy metal translocating P-type ATPase [Candidatus Scalindua sp.]|jgi:Cu2+-exporting ATPase/Cu+-exporting ATPase|nr:heavy metal translocating P-type ATPase [Candidatus Scalindua sp.]MBT5306912.1 heavy metal translocating P-type ATPase [Candidatus Scalindua sp.]MBT6048998.1 heavy metal translocating P-type ATPase [Candidatus Scalindua sp.]MBT6229292.1 heavy metal translocating P-type ATPase [Candidatus Scalindua sp.]MBT6561139.1 heavy metal translocating P-type ATPase [Candidatus Scalindua sp.]